MMEFLSSLADNLAAFIVTYLVHSTMWILLVVVVRRVWTSVSSETRVLLWKSALVVPVITSVAVSLIDLPHGGFTLHIADIGQTYERGESAQQPAIPGMSQHKHVAVGGLADSAWLADKRNPAEFAHGDTNRSLSAGNHLNDLAQPGNSSTFHAGPDARTRSGIGFLFVLTCMGAGVIACLKVCAQVRRLRSLRQRGERMTDASVTTLVDVLAAKAGLRQRVEVAQSLEIQGPLTAGVVRPFILVPCDFMDRFSDEDRRALFAHELAHVARRDALWKLIGQTVCQVFFFQPFNFVVRRQLEIDAEFVADEQAALLLGDRCSLANCLTRMGEWFAVCPTKNAAAQPLAAGMASFRSTLGQRIETLLNENHQCRPVSAQARFTLVILFIAAITVATVLAPRAVADTFPENSPTLNSDRGQPMKRQFATIAVLAGLTLPAMADDEQQAKEQPRRAAAAKKTPDTLPEQAVGLGGVLVGRVVTRDVEHGSFVIHVDAVPRVWKNSTARNPKSLVGKNVEVDGLTGKWLDVLLLAKEGETLEVAARHHGGNKVTFPGEMFRKVAPYKAENYPELSEGFRGFQGAVAATVVRKDTRMYELVIQVDRVIDTWKGSQAKKPAEMENKQAMLVGFWRRKEAYNGLKVGDKIEVGLQHIGRQTDMLTVAEFIRKAEKPTDSPRPRKESADRTRSEEGFPAGMHGFNGMLVGRLVKKDVEKGTFIVAVDAVPRVWRNSKAESPKSIVKRNVEIDGVFGKWLDVLLVIKEGETLEFEARHDGEARLTFPGELLRKVAPYKAEDYPVLPEEFRGFQGAIAATIIKKDPETFELIVKVERILETAKNSSAKKPNSIAGRKMMLAGFWQRKDAYHGLKVGDGIEVGLKHIGRQSDHLSVADFVRKTKKAPRPEGSKDE
jgi:beta-lactamase regulating signal transducer with metallopeptidase domain